MKAKRGSSSGSMKNLQDSLMEIETESKKQVNRTSKVTSLPSIFTDLQNHTSGKKGQANRVIKAITGVILDQGGDTIPTSYFALLLTSIPSTSDQEELDVLLYLLRLLLPELSSPVLSAKFDDVSMIMQNILSTQYESSLIVVNVSFFIICNIFLCDLIKRFLFLDS